MCEKRQERCSRHGSCCKERVVIRVRGHEEGCKHRFMRAGKKWYHHSLYVCQFQQETKTQNSHLNFKEARSHGYFLNLPVKISEIKRSDEEKGLTATSSASSILLLI